MPSDHADDARSDSYRLSRRTVLAAVGAAGLGASGAGIGLTSAGSRDQSSDAPVPTFVFGVDQDGWHGVAPEPIAGTVNPALELDDGRTYRVLWQNRDGLPHGMAITNEEGVRLDALRVLQADADDLRVFDGAAPDGESLAWNDLENGTVQYLDVEDQPVAADAVSGDGYVDATSLEGANDAVVEPLSYSPVVAEEGGVQALEFEARPAMTGYADVAFPYSGDGSIRVVSGSD